MYTKLIKTTPPPFNRMLQDILCFPILLDYKQIIAYTESPKKLVAIHCEYLVGTHCSIQCFNLSSPKITLYNKYQCNSSKTKKYTKFFNG